VRRATILIYHGVSDKARSEIDSPGLHLPLAEFEAQMEFLARECNVLLLTGLVHHITERVPFPPAAVALTFDDGYANVIRCALPVLERLGLPALLYCTAGLMGTREMHWNDVFSRAAARLPEPSRVDASALPPEYAGEGWRARKQHLKDLPDATRRAFIAQLTELIADLGPPGESRVASREELAAWVAAGMAVGSHTMTHPILPRLADADLEWELAESMRVLEGVVGAPVTAFAYPNGGFDARVRDAVSSAGYTSATILGARDVILGCDLLALPRCTSGTSVERLEGTVSGVEAAVVGPWKRIRAVRPTGSG
jgi:peptidoglycan/xylan/chitin deacetylase (PgdA/CDA1 family)